MVRFPHRADRVVDHRARALAALGAAGDEVPEPGAEVGAAEERVRGDAEEQHDRDDVAVIRPAPPRRRRVGHARAHSGRTGTSRLVELVAGLAEAPAHAAQHEDQA